MNDTIEKRQEKEKALLLEKLRKLPVVGVACAKVGVSRATYYRWRQEDSEFTSKADAALKEGVDLVNDMAQSKIIMDINNGVFQAGKFWLTHHHPAYANRIEIMSGMTKENLSEQEIKELAGLLFNTDTFRQGQQQLTSLVVSGKISEKIAELILRMFISQMRAEDILTRKAEADILSEVMLRKEKK